MLLVRSWPALVPAGHPRVEDQITRVLLTEPFDYTPLCALGDDVLHLDWDVAVSVEDLETFAAQAASQVLVAPYRIYPSSLLGSSGERGGHTVWAAKCYTDAYETAMRYVSEGEPNADLFGFGMIYLPAPVLAAWPGGRMGDIEFAGWHHRMYGPAAMCWDVRPVHVNFSASAVTL